MNLEFSLAGIILNNADEYGMELAAHSDALEFDLRRTASTVWHGPDGELTMMFTGGTGVSQSGQPAIPYFVMLLPDGHPLLEDE